MPAQPASRYSWLRLLDRVERDRAVGRERGDERDVHALEQPATQSRARGYRVGQRAGPEKDGVDHGLGELAGERVLLRRVEAAEHDAPAPSAPRPVAELGRGRRQRRAGGGEHPADRLVGERAEHHDHAGPGRAASSSRTRYGRQRVALLGRRLVGRRRAAHRRGDVRGRAARARRRPTTDVGWLAKPVRNSDAKRKSPERSPVNTRPVRLAPCAAGARPATSTRARGSPKPGTGRPQ